MFFNALIEQCSASGIVDKVTVMSIVCHNENTTCVVNVANFVCNCMHNYQN